MFINFCSLISALLKHLGIFFLRGYPSNCIPMVSLLKPTSILFFNIISVPLTVASAPLVSKSMFSEYTQA